MSIVPMFFEEMARPLSIFDQNFGLGLMNEDLYQPMMNRSYYRPWRHLTRQQSGVSNVINDKDKFQVNLDVQQFTPEEITVKTVDNTVTIEGKHEEKQDEHGYITRHFVRRYVLPKDVHTDNVQCNLSSDGILAVIVPKKVRNLFFYLVFLTRKLNFEFSRMIFNL
jgi:crystallin, alpha B